MLLIGAELWQLKIGRYIFFGSETYIGRVSVINNNSFHLLG